MFQNSSKKFLILGLWFLTLPNFGIKGEYPGRTTHSNRPIKKEQTTVEVLKQAEAAENAGDLEKAGKFYLQLVQFFETTQGPENPDSINMFINLQRVYFNSRKFQAAFPLAWKIYKLQEKILGKEHPDTVDALTQLGMTYLMRGKYQKAEEILKRAYRLTKAQLGQNHEKTVEILSGLAQIYRDSREPKNLEMALRYYKKVWEVLKNDPQFGEEHDRTLEALRNIGNVLGLQEKRMEAVAIFEQVLEILGRKPGGEDHPLTKEVRHVLFATLTFAGETGQARKFLEEHSQFKVEDEDETFFKLVEGKATVLGEKQKYGKALKLLTGWYEHEILKPQLSPRIINVLSKLISFSYVEKDLNLLLKWANVMIDFAQNQKETQRINIITEMDEYNLILIHLHALEGAIYVYAQKNDEEKVDEHFSKVREVYKGQIQGQGQGEQRWVNLLEKYFRIIRVVADFKRKIGKKEDAAVLYEDLAQNGQGDLDSGTEEDGQRKCEL